MQSSESWLKGDLLRNGNFEDGLQFWHMQTRGRAGVMPGNFNTIKGVSENRVAEIAINGPGLAKIGQEAAGITAGSCYELSFFIRNASNTLTGPGIFCADLMFMDQNGELLDYQSYAISNPARLLVWTYHFLVSNGAPPGSKKIRVELYGKVKDPGSTLRLLMDDVELKKI